MCLSWGIWIANEIKGRVPVHLKLFVFVRIIHILSSAVFQKLDCPQANCYKNFPCSYLPLLRNSIVCLPTEFATPTRIKGVMKSIQFKNYNGQICR